MTTKGLSLPDVVDLHSARSVADGLLRHIRAATTPSVNTAKLRQAGVPLLQILVAARQFAEAQGKPFTVAAEPGGALGLRRGEVQVNASLIAISLQACDQILRLLDAPEAAAQDSTALLGRLHDCLNGNDSPTTPGVADASTKDEEADIPEICGLQPERGPGLRVVFRLASDALMHGHDPELMLDDLKSLGPCRVRALVDTIPPLDQLDPTTCLIGWEVEIAGPVDPAAAEAVFLFTRDAMTLNITSLGAADPNPVALPLPADATAPDARTGAPAAPTPAPRGWDEPR